MALMASLYIGTSGLQTSQNALNTTAHNLSNIDTVGYTRQQVQQSNRSYFLLNRKISGVSDMQTGLGVYYSRAKQVRDVFLDQTYRRESGRSMFYEVSHEVMEEVESQLGEMNGKAFQGTIADLWTSIQELAKDPSSSVTQALLVRRASEFVERAESVYKGLASYQDNLNIQIKNQVKKINDYGKKILDLNDRIRAIECGGVEKANDLRDARNQMLDELAEMAEIDYGEDMWGNVYVQIEGVDFVKGAACYEIDLKEDPNTGFFTPFWPMNASYKVLEDGTRDYNIDGAEVFDLEREISTDLGTDIGGLKAMLLARGNHRADYRDVMPGNYDGVSQSVLMNVQAEFDQLIHNVVTKVNDILATAAGVETGELEIVREDGSTMYLTGVRSAASDPNGYLRGDKGDPLQLFAKATTAGYEKVTAYVKDKHGNKIQLKDENGNLVVDKNNKPVYQTEERWVYQEENLSRSDSLYTVKNLVVSPELMQSPSKLGFIKEDGSVDQDTADALKAAFAEEKYTLNPNVKKTTSFADYYNDLVAQVGNSGYVFGCIYSNQETTVEAAQAAREQVVGVSSDEELSNMIRFQNAYNASSRYINVISEMLEHIINTLGV